MSRLAVAMVATGFLLYIMEVVLWGLSMLPSLPDYFLVSISLLIIGNILQDREFSSKPSLVNSFMFCTQCNEVSHLVCRGCGETYCEVCYSTHSVENVTTELV